MNINDFNNTEQWGQAELGYARRNQRAIQIGQAIANSPDASLPEQMTNWGDLKAADRLLNCEDINHTILSQPHWKKTCELALFVKALTSNKIDLLQKWICGQIEG